MRLTERGKLNLESEVLINILKSMSRPSSCMEIYSYLYKKVFDLHFVGQ